ncbi:MAG: hypothetical protein LBD82_04965 [Deltaproteobacteria bacterium]|nr:hypothetical protein [Deltaproteobacteria bacterium]
MLFSAACVIVPIRKYNRQGRTCQAHIGLRDIHGDREDEISAALEKSLDEAGSYT